MEAEGSHVVVKTEPELGFVKEELDLEFEVYNRNVNVKCEQYDVTIEENKKICIKHEPQSPTSSEVKLEFDPLLPENHGIAPHLNFSKPAHIEESNENVKDFQMASTSKKIQETEMSTYLDELSDSDSFIESDSDLSIIDIPGIYFHSVHSDSDAEVEADSNATRTCSRHVSPNSNDAPNSNDELEDEEYLEVLPPEQSLPDPFPFLELSGPKNMPSADSQPIDYVNLFFTMSLLSLMVVESNRYAKQVINGMGRNVPQYLRKWKSITINEIKGFLACLIAMGMNPKCSIASYWTTSGPLETPWFRETFTKHRFSHLLRFFHLVDNSKLPGPGESGYDPRAKYQPLEDHANRVFRHYYIPHKEISVNEALVGTKNRTSQLQYIPNTKWEIKIWMLCDSISHYCLGFFTYRGAKSQEEKHSISKFGLEYIVVRRLLDIGNYNNKGYHVFIDDYFTSVPLIRHLYSQGTYITGMVRRNRKQLPPQFRRKFSLGQTSYFRSGPILACGFREKTSEKKPVLLLSSHAGARDDQIVKRGVAISKPQVVLSYNKFMGGVDVSDQMLYAYLDKRRNIKYWKKVAFNIIARMVLNAYLLYRENSRSRGKVLSRHAFNLAVIDSLARECREERKESLCPPDPRGPVGLRKLPGRMAYRCIVCSTSKHRKTTTKACTRCGKGVHADCLVKHCC
ncbi:piggyBac transposable element-derived protein 4-like [Centruroides vittatus]|uniref:piggyBac transposable element-derived protein 4-like n=1 Tax=Centruroides vittatus TaxID=120091 RepID=UPI0035104555